MSVTLTICDHCDLATKSVPDGSVWTLEMFCGAGSVVPAAGLAEGGDLDSRRGCWGRGAMVGLIWPVRADAEFRPSNSGREGWKTSNSRSARRSLRRSRSISPRRKGCRRLRSDKHCSQLNGSTMSRPCRFVRCGGWSASLALIDVRSGDCASDNYRSDTWAGCCFDTTDDVREFRMRSV